MQCIEICKKWQGLTIKGNILQENRGLAIGDKVIRGRGIEKRETALTDVLKSRFPEYAFTFQHARLRECKVGSQLLTFKSVK